MGGHALIDLSKRFERPVTGVQPKCRCFHALPGLKQQPPDRIRVGGGGEAKIQIKETLSFCDWDPVQHPKTVLTPLNVKM